MSENTFFLNEVNNIKDILDKMTDICENPNLLDKNKLFLLNEFIKKHKNYLANDIKINKSEVI